MKVLNKKIQCNSCIRNTAYCKSIYTNKASCNICHVNYKRKLLYNGIIMYNNSNYKEKEEFWDHYLNCKNHKCMQYNKLCYLLKGKNYIKFIKKILIARKKEESESKKEKNKKNIKKIIDYLDKTFIHKKK